MANVRLPIAVGTSVAEKKKKKNDQKWTPSFDPLKFITDSATLRKSKNTTAPREEARRIILL